LLKSNKYIFTLVPTARAVPPRDGLQPQLVLVSGEEEEQQRLARLNIGANNRNQNFATKVMSNGVEVIVAGNNIIYGLEYLQFNHFCKFCIFFR
jgi:hypothetical protein